MDYVVIFADEPDMDPRSVLSNDMEWFGSKKEAEGFLEERAEEGYIAVLCKVQKEVVQEFRVKEVK